MRFLWFIAKLRFRPLLIGLSVAYLLLDLALKGPLYQRVERLLPGRPSSEEMGARQGWAATVNGNPITKAQLDLAIDLFLARRGKSRQDLTKENLGITQLAVLNQLINDELVRIWSQAQPVEAPEEFLYERVRQFELHFPPGELEEMLRSQRLSRAELRSILREHARQQYWLEEKTRGAYVVTQEETKDWFAQYGKKVQMPEMIRARHLFLSSVFGDVSAKEKLVPELAGQLREGRASFEQLCAAHSEDERTKNIGGEMGYFSRARVPPDFAEQAFSQAPGLVGEVFRTKLGWHIVQVLDRVPSREVSWEELRPEIEAYLENDWRSRAVETLLQEQLRSARRARVQVFAPALEISNFQ